MNIKRSVVVAVMTVLVMPTFSQATTTESSYQPCDIDVAMQQGRSAAAQRDTNINRAGILIPNTTIIDKLPTVNQGACLDQVYELMDAITEQIGGSWGAIFRSVAGDRLARMGCRKVRQYYHEILDIDIGRFDDEFGILRSGEIREYSEGRTTRVDVQDAIRLGRKATEALNKAPEGPIGRTPPSSTNSAPANREGLNNAIQGL